MITKLRRTIQKRLLTQGIEVRKAPSSYKPLPVFRLAMQALMAARGDAISFVQVGANDGLYDDPLRPFVLNRGWKGILVEPQPEIFERLKQNYAECADRLIFENLAISFDEQLVLYLAPEGYKPPVEGIQVESMASGDPKVLAEQIGVNASELRKVEVPAMTLDALFAKHGITELDLLQIDAEGYDWHVLQTLDLAKVRPIVIQLETGHLDRPTLAELAAKLNEAEYDFYYGGYSGDGIAIRSDFIVTQ